MDMGGLNVPGPTPAHAQGRLDPARRHRHGQGRYALHRMRRQTAGWAQRPGVRQAGRASGSPTTAAARPRAASMGRCSPRPDRRLEDHRWRDHFVSPNGVGLSPDEKTVYMADTMLGRLWSFDIVSPGVLADAAPLQPGTWSATCRAISCWTAWRSRPTARSAWRRSSTAGSPPSRRKDHRALRRARRDRDQHLLRRGRHAGCVDHGVGNGEAVQGPVAAAGVEAEFQRLKSGPPLWGRRREGAGGEVTHFGKLPLRRLR